MMPVIELGTFHPATIARFVWDGDTDLRTDERVLADSVMQTARNAPSDYVAEIKTLLSLVCDTGSHAANRRRVIECVLQSRDAWVKASMPFASVASSEILAVSQPLVQAFDHDGLSLYARMLLFVVGLFKEKVIHDTESAALSSSSSSSSLSWIWVELARFAVLCDDVGALGDAARLPWTRDCAITHTQLAQEIRTLFADHVKACVAAASAVSARGGRGRAVPATSAANDDGGDDGENNDNDNGGEGSDADHSGSDDNDDVAATAAAMVEVDQGAAEEALQHVKGATAAAGETTPLAVAALDHALAAAPNAAVRLGYARAMLAVHQRVFAPRRLAVHADLAAWLLVHEALEKREDAFAADLALLLALQPHVADASASARSVGAAVRALVDRLAKIDRGMLADGDGLALGACVPLPCDLVLRRVSVDGGGCVAVRVRIWA
nr:hypothetical protein HK105_001634 [Polyrhizophydium stewartii]